MTRMVTLNGCCREQVGRSVYLVKGSYYFIRALVKEGGGGDYLHLSATWPGHTRETYMVGRSISSMYFECPRRATSNIFCKSDGRWSKNPVSAAQCKTGAFPYRSP